MARNGSGTMSIVNSFSSNTTIESAKVNQNFSDIGSEITGSLPRNGEAGMTGQFKSADGTSSAPGITFSSDPDTGIYRTGPNAFAMSAAGTAVVAVGTSGLDVTGSLTSSTAGTSSTSVVSCPRIGHPNVGRALVMHGSISNDRSHGATANC
jgi:hypothetical protein